MFINTEHTNYFMAGLIVCSHCSYSWETKSTKQKVCCPDCMYKIKNTTLKTPPLIKRAVQGWLSD